MDLTKNVTYTFVMNPAEVMALHAELKQLFDLRPDLSKALPNVAVLTRGLADRLGNHDYNPKAVANMIKGMEDRGLYSALGVEKPAVAEVKSDAAPSSETPVASEGNTSSGS